MVARFIPKFLRDLFDVPAPEVGKFLRWGSNGQIENADAPGGTLTPPVDVDAAGAEGNGGRVVFPYFQNPIPFVDAGGIPTGGLLVKMRDEGGNTCANIMSMSRVWTEGEFGPAFATGNQYSEEGGAHLELKKWRTRGGMWALAGGAEVVATDDEGCVILAAEGNESGLNQNRAYFTKSGQDVIRIDNGGAGSGPYLGLRDQADSTERLRCEVDAATGSARVKAQGRFDLGDGTFTDAVRVEFPKLMKPDGFETDGLAVFEGLAGACANFYAFGNPANDLEAGGNYGMMEASASGGTATLDLRALDPGAGVRGRVWGLAQGDNVHIEMESAGRIAGLYLPAPGEGIGLTPYLLLESPNGTRYRITVSDAGALVVTPV